MIDARAEFAVRGRTRKFSIDLTASLVHWSALVLDNQYEIQE